MKSNVSGRVLSQSGSSSSSSGCRPQQNFFYNFHHHQNQSHQQQQQHQNHHQQQPYHPHHHQQPPPPSQHQNYAMLPCFNQHNANGWAGIPLISTAASSNRRQRKPTVGGGQRHPPPPTPQSMSCNSLQQIYNSNRDLHSNEYDMNPMTRLAMHTQGAPLLLSGSYNRNRLNCNRQLRPLNPNSSEGYNSSCGNGGSGVGGFKPNVPIHHQKTKENNISGPVGSCGGVTNTQSDSATVACLPRIIKPRKRRKKDRKPLPNTTNFIKKMDHETDTGGVFPRRDHHQLYIDQNQHQHHITLPSSSQMLSGGGGDCGNGFNEFENIRCNLKNDEPSHVTDAQDPATGSICFCRQCDPLSRIWAFPLRRSHSDNSSDTTEFERATINKNVGVIGSNRSQVNLKTTTTGSLSDSSDSGYGDILSGIQIGDNFFQNNHDNNNYLQLQKLPNDLLLSPTAESLLTESINEISRKLMETCDIKGASTGGSIGCGSSSSSSSSSSTSDSCSVFSDSGLSSATSNNQPSGDELIFNFENLSINSLNQHHPNLMFPNATNVNNESMFDCFSTSADINNNTIYVPASDGGGGGGGVGSPRIDPQLFNCLDMLWGTHSTHSSSLLMHSDAPKQISSSPSSSSTTSSSSSSSSTSFYRPAVASM
ncbi:transcription factor mef2A [Episyrphus balteatus]|uniref:transcription factor mef2A n=1 Tax=Episyrphus balteatus TaxID=286459 RepID=UPI0024869ED3|nr:transcription factor mef2A [Episyrphus balteatus]